MSGADLFLTIEEVDRACKGLKQPAARIRHLKALGLRVDKTPSGQPLVWRPAAAANDAAQNRPDDAVAVSLQQWAANRGKHGQKTQRR